MSLSTPLGRAPLEPAGRHADAGLPAAEQLCFYPTKVDLVADGRRVAE